MNKQTRSQNQKQNEQEKSQQMSVHPGDQTPQSGQQDQQSRQPRHQPGQPDTSHRNMQQQGWKHASGQGGSNG